MSVAAEHRARPGHPGAEASPSAPDRRGLAALAAGHFTIDMCVGAVPAFLVGWTASFALSDLAASMILGASLLVSSAIQPAFGILADRRATPAFLWAGVVVAATGLAAAGLATGYAGVVACIVASGLGIAAFHPEAARVANRLAGERTATGLAAFMVGGNAGFAAGPLLATLVTPLAGQRATLAFLVPGALATAWMLAVRRRLSVAVPARAGRERTPSAGPGRGGAVGLLLVVTSLRTWAQFGLLALVPLLLVDERGDSDTAAGWAVFAFAGAGAAGTIAGAALADRLGGRRMLALTMPLATPFVAGFLVTGGPLSIALLAGAGFVLMASFSVTVAMAQEYLPHRLALAAGLMIGLGSIGSAPPGLALFGAIADGAGREAAIWGLAALPLLAGLLAIRLPAARPAGARA